MISKSKTSLSTSHQECHQDVAKQQQAIGGGGGSNGWFRVSNSSKYLLEKCHFGVQFPTQVVDLIFQQSLYRRKVRKGDRGDRLFLHQLKLNL